MMDQEKSVLSRESFTLPTNEKKELNELSSTFPGIKPALKKSELIRLGIISLKNKDKSEIDEMLRKDFIRFTAGRPTANKSKERSTNNNSEILISDRQWKSVLRVLPKSNLNKKGVPKKNDRLIIDGILFIFRFDIQRREIPKEYKVSFSTCRRRLFEWINKSKWKNICIDLLANAEVKDKNSLEGIFLRTLLLKHKI